MPIGSVMLTIDSDLAHVFLVGWTVNKICSACGLGDQAAYEAEVAVVEAVNNCIEHAYANEGGHPVLVAIATEPEHIVFRVCDYGTAPPETWPASGDPGVAGPAELAEGGRGLLIIQAFMDEVRFSREDAANVVTMVKRLGRPQPH